jgi:hypothetical protein
VVYVFVALAIGSRRLIHFNQAWLRLATIISEYRNHMAVSAAHKQ